MGYESASISRRGPETKRGIIFIVSMRVRFKSQSRMYENLSEPKVKRSTNYVWNFFGNSCRKKSARTLYQVVQGAQQEAHKKYAIDAKPNISKNELRMVRYQPRIGCSMSSLL